MSIVVLSMNTMACIYSFKANGCMSDIGSQGHFVSTIHAGGNACTKDQSYWMLLAQQGNVQAYRLNVPDTGSIEVVCYIEVGF
jgi:hypothetical protein